MSVLPVTTHTLIYGSMDGGKTIVKKESDFNSIMKRAMVRLVLMAVFSLVMLSLFSFYLFLITFMID